jgi:ATP-dependent DNA helicase RecG
MPAIDLTELATRESEQVEWKENVADIDDVVEALCAFANDLANLGGGYVVCGAREVRDEHGLPRMMRAGLTAARLKEVDGRVLARCRERVAPPLAPLVTELPADTEDRRVLVFTQPATSSAHTFRRDREGAKHFVRVGRSTIEARNGILLNLLVRKGATESWDRRVCTAATERDLDLLALRDTLNQMGVGLPDSRVDQFLSEDSSLSPFVPPLCVREPLTNVLRPRNFAVLLFGRNVQRFIPGAFSLFSIYPGTDRSDRYAERHELAGSLIEQARRFRPLLDAQTFAAFDKGDPETPNAVKYPSRALYEAMGNALAHRDYELFDPIRVTAFADRVEFLSPGSLPLGVDATAFERGEAPPKWRNQALAWFFNRLQLAQAEGQGIPTILRTMREEGCPPPVFQTNQQSVTCALPAHPRHVLQFAIADALRAIGHGDNRQARDRIEFILQNLDLLKSGLRVNPEPLIDLAHSMSREEAIAEQFRALVIRLIAFASKQALSESDLLRAADICFRYRDTDALIRIIENQLTAMPQLAKSPRLLNLAGELLLRAAVQATNSIGSPHVSSLEWPSFTQDFQAASDKASSLFTEVLTTPDSKGEQTARRALAIIQHLKAQAAADTKDAGGQPDA